MSYHKTTEGAVHVKTTIRNGDVDKMRKLLKRKSFQILLFAVILMITSIGATATAQVLSGKSQSEAVATVNGDTISKDELYKILVEKNGQEVLDSLIADKILELELQAQNIQVAEADIQAEIQKISEQYGGQEAFEQALESYGYSMEDVRKDIEQYLNKSKLLEPEITITDEEMKSYFEENKDAFNGATYEDSTADIKRALFDQKLSTTYDTWLQDKYTKYGVEKFIEEK